MYKTQIENDNKLNIKLYWDKGNEEKGIKITHFFLNNMKELNIGYEIDNNAKTFAQMSFDTKYAIMPIRVILRNEEYSDKNFEDIIGIEAETYIRHLHDFGVINGKTEKEFYPFESIKRSEFIVLLIKALGIEVLKNKETNFKDINDHWARDFIITGFEKGFISGFSASEFKPDDYLTLGQICTLIDKAIKFKTSNIGVYKNLTLDKWYSKSVKKIFDSGILKTTDKLYETIDEEEYISRANVAMILSRAITTY